jgi:hypothetical protein
VIFAGALCVYSAWVWIQRSAMVANGVSIRPGLDSTGGTRSDAGGSTNTAFVQHRCLLDRRTVARVTATYRRLFTGIDCRIISIRNTDR